MPVKILVIEDDQAIQIGLKKALELNEYSVTQAFNGEIGLQLAKNDDFDLIILDIMMPIKGGFEVLFSLRKSKNEVPIFILSARTDSQDKVYGFKLGADDYIEKPFSIEEVLARIERKLQIKSKSYAFGAHHYEFKTKILSTNSEIINLTTKEIKLLELFILKKNQIISREQMIQNVWSDDYDGTERTVDNCILNLRKKIGKQHIVTVHGLGYRFLPSP